MPAVHALDLIRFSFSDYTYELRKERERGWGRGGRKMHDESVREWAWSSESDNRARIPLYKTQVGQRSRRVFINVLCARARTQTGKKFLDYFRCPFRIPRLSLPLRRRTSARRNPEVVRNRRYARSTDLSRYFCAAKSPSVIRLEAAPSLGNWVI